jgi:hypothetical protein
MISRGGTQEIGVANSCYNPLDVESQQLVLDVPDGTRVILRRKETGARSQLWRMTGDGQLQHEGSSPPRDPRSKHSVHNDDRILASYKYFSFEQFLLKTLSFVANKVNCLYSETSECCVRDEAPNLGLRM